MKPRSVLPRIGLACGVALALGLASTAAAQEAPVVVDPELEYDELDEYEWELDEEGQIEPREGIVPRGQLEQQIARRGQVSGTVTGLDLHHGRVVLQTGEGRGIFYANPNQLVGLQLGDRFSGRVAMVGQNAWILEDVRANREELRRYGRTGTVRGTVTRVNRDAGTMTLMTPRRESVTLRGHPLEIQRVQRGAQISAQVQMVGDAIWVQQVRQEARQPAERFPRELDDDLEWGAPY